MCSENRPVLMETAAVNVGDASSTRLRVMLGDSDGDVVTVIDDGVGRDSDDS